jgi:hypothetical protein
VTDHTCTWEAAAELGMARYRCTGCGLVGHRGSNGGIVAYKSKRAPTTPEHVVPVGTGRRKPSLDDYERSRT